MVTIAVPQICRWHHPYDRKWRGTKEPLDESEEENEKFGLKLNIQKTKIMASGPITSWQIDGETKERVTDFIFLGSKITAYVDCSHEIKRHLLLGRKDMTNLDSVLKGRDITLPTKVCLVKVMVFPVIMYGCESWTVKKAEGRIIDVFELWCWRRLLRVPWTARKSNQPMIKEISPEYSLEDWCWSSNTLTTLCKELTHCKRPCYWARLKVGGEGDDRGWDVWMASLTQWTWVWTSSRSWWWTDKPGVLQSMGSQRVRLNWVTQLSELMYVCVCMCVCMHVSVWRWKIRFKIATPKSYKHWIQLCHPF